MSSMPKCQAAAYCKIVFVIFRS